MVSNPRQSANIIDFVNDMKKSGLFILGHVKVGRLDDCRKDPALTEQANWLSLVDYLKVSFRYLLLFQTGSASVRTLVLCIVLQLHKNCLNIHYSPTTSYNYVALWHKW